jgi:hypothetical protein
MAIQLRSSNARNRNILRRLSQGFRVHLISTSRHRRYNPLRSSRIPTDFQAMLRDSESALHRLDRKGNSSLSSRKVTDPRARFRDYLQTFSTHSCSNT